jgi:hypothetical protein
MGLDTTHGCWRGAYSAFNRWRCKLAEVVGIPLELMEGFYRPPDEEAMRWLAPGTDGNGPVCKSHYGPAMHYWLETAVKWLPIRWEVLSKDVLHVLLNHSDCDGDIKVYDCGPLADRLEQLLPLLDGDGGGHVGNYREKTQKFINGLRRAAADGEDIQFS